MGSNPLRAPPRPVKREVKREGQRRIPPAPKEEVDNPEDFTEYPLKACRKEDIESVRTHILKFQSKTKVDPASFHQPVRLHRKDTKNLQYQLTRAEIEQRQRENAEKKAKLEEQAAAEAARAAEDPNHVMRRADIKNDPNVAPEPEKTEEQKKQERLERQLKHIAPDGGARRNKQPIKQRKTRQLKAVKEEDKKLRYEEYYPWVMEDYDGKNTYVGSFEAGNSDTYALLVFDQNGFKMIPAEKVYRFTPRNKYATLTLEEAERRMAENQQAPRWLMKHLDENEQKLTRFERTQRKLKTVVGTSQNDKGGRDSDNDDLDFEEDFADDEEAPIIDGNEEENRESEQRIKKEMRNANAMGLHDDEHYEEDDDLFEDRKFDKEGERVRKALMKTDASGMYESDDDANPYLNESDLEIDNSEDEEVIKADLSKPTSPVPINRHGSPSPSIKTIRVKSVNKPIGVVVLKALPSVLVKFPKGDWNPNAKKRVVEHFDSEDTNHSSKRVKLENEGSELPPVVKVEDNGATELPSDDLLQEQDIIDLVTREKVTAKELIHKLKHKLSKHPDNTNRIKLLARQLLKNQDGILVLKQ